MSILISCNPTNEPTKSNNHLPYIKITALFIPVGDTQVKGGFKPQLAYAFIVINVLIFLYQFSLATPHCEQFINTFGTIPIEILRFEDLYTLLTSMFLHAGWMHLIGNMLFLWIFADNIEAVVGRTEFVLFYLMGGLFASFAHILFNPSSIIPAVGASGAIAAVMGAYIVLFPKSKIKVIFVLFFMTIHMRAIWFLGLWFAQELLSGVGNLGVTTAETSGVAYWAHIGGFVFGLLYGYLRKDKISVKYNFTP